MHDSGSLLIEARVPGPAGMPVSHPMRGARPHEARPWREPPQACPVWGTLLKILTGRVLRNTRTRVRALTCGVRFGVRLADTSPDPGVASGASSWSKGNNGCPRPRLARSWRDPVLPFDTRRQPGDRRGSVTGSAMPPEPGVGLFGPP